MQHAYSAIPHGSDTVTHGSTRSQPASVPETVSLGPGRFALQGDQAHLDAWADTGHGYHVETRKAVLRCLWCDYTAVGNTLAEVVALYRRAHEQPILDRNVEQCFHCAADETLARGVSRYDRDEVWDRPTVHMQIPESACPHSVEGPQGVTR